MTATGTPPRSSWRTLLSPPHLGPVVVLAGGVALYATNVYLTTSLLPSATREIGGEQLYAWTTTIFLLSSVTSSVLVSRVLTGSGDRRGYLYAVGLFVAGTLVCALAPNMPIVLAGRAVQGAGGGLLAGLGYALIRSALPSELWTRASALVSAMWGVGTFVGPALGGAFAQFGSWRAAFVALAVAGVAIGAMVPQVLSSSRPDIRPERFPLVALGLLAGASVAVTVASLIATVLAGVAGIVVGLVLIAGFVGYERRGRVRILPASTFATGSRLPGTYATLAVLAIGSTTETFVPLFGQRLAGLAPLATGFLGAALAAGWTMGELCSSSAVRETAIRRTVIAGPVALALGLALAALTQRDHIPGGLVALWTVALLIAGSGIGIAWPHLSTQAMQAVDDPAEGDRAAAAINTVQLVANSFGTAMTGLAVNLGEPGTVVSAHYLFLGFAVLTAFGVLPAVAGQRRRPSGWPNGASGAASQPLPECGSHNV
jgi:MFS family permease